MTQFQPFDAPPILAGDVPSQRPGWPTVFGVISMVLGGLGIASNACGAVMSFSAGSLLAWLAGVIPKPKAGAAPGPDLSQITETMAVMKPWMAVGGVLSILSVGISAWLFAAGMSLVRRRPSGVGLHKGWAWARIATVLLVVVLTVVSSAATANEVARIEAAHGMPSSAGTKVVLGVVQAAFALAWGAAYPIVVLWYMRKPDVTAHAANWRV
jgi:hypothetical protein